MVGTEGVPAEIVPMTFFLQIKQKIILILIQLRQKMQNLIFFKKWTYNKIELTSRNDDVMSNMRLLSDLQM